MGNTPHTFGCQICRRFWHIHWVRQESYLNKGQVERVVLTGRVRKKVRTARREYPRSGATSFEYTCLDCGHVGWSAHSDLGYKADREGVQRHHEDPRGTKKRTQ